MHSGYSCEPKEVAGLAHVEQVNENKYHLNKRSESFLFPVFAFFLLFPPGYWYS